MMDREMLELAAKAAGLSVLGEWDEKLGHMWNGEGWSFDPLEDDGDSLRLAVKLRIHLEFAGRASSAADRVQASPRGHGHLAWVQMFEGDDSAATRRAITRAAAEIGKSMP